MAETLPAGNRSAIRAVPARMTFLGTAVRHAAAVGALALLTAACAPTGGPDPASSASPGGWFSPGAATVSVHRTGGFAGVDDRITVTPAGAWTATDRARTSKSGELTISEREQLQTLAADPRLNTEATRPTTPTKCADAFQYTVTVDRTGGNGTVTVSFAECPGDENLPATAAAIATLVTGATGS
ncbi:protealysin inhibitor emfourin [Catellatospora sp. NPDC049111]|uniref:protealysin inhibitor emfourin n=1 Tax=Catellatospora sp. NPDC049111 TaxID=3155271 RepID=UPI0033F0A972